MAPTTAPTTGAAQTMAGVAQATNGAAQARVADRQKVRKIATGVVPARVVVADPQKVVIGEDREVPAKGVAPVQKERKIADRLGNQVAQAIGLAPARVVVVDPQKVVIGEDRVVPAKGAAPAKDRKAAALKDRAGGREAPAVGVAQTTNGVVDRRKILMMPVTGKALPAKAAADGKVQAVADRATNSAKVSPPRV